MILKMRAVLYDRGMLATAYSHAQFSTHSPPACGFHWSLGRVTADLAPANLPKDAAHEGLREPLENKRITFSRAASKRMPGESG
jgi:hypothetical protein